MAIVTEFKCECGAKASCYEYKDQGSTSGTHYVFTCEKTNMHNQGPSYCPWCGGSLKSHQKDCKKSKKIKKKQKQK